MIKQRRLKQKEFSETKKSIEEIIIKKQTIPCSMFRMYFLYAQELFLNKDVGYYEINTFLELLQKIEVNTNNQELLDQIMSCIIELRKNCMKSIYKKNPKTITNSVISHINRLRQIVKNNERITFQEYKKKIKNFLETLLMEIDIIDYIEWAELLLEIEPNFRTIKEFDEVKLIKSVLYNIRHKGDEKNGNIK